METPATNWEGNSSFHTDLPFLQVAWDSTSLGTLKECPRKYQYTMVLGRQPKADSVHLIFGGHYHAILERYDHGRSEGMDHHQAVRKALRYAFEATGSRNAEGKFIPWRSDDSYKNRETLIRTCLWYLDHFEHDTVQTIQLANGKPAVELSFRFESGIPIGDGSEFLLSGHIDRLVTFNDEVHVLDRKTSKEDVRNQGFFDKFKPDNQMTLYTLATQVVWQAPAKAVIIDGAQIQVNGSRFNRGFTSRSKKDLEEWYADTMHYLRMATHYAEAEYWPMNDKSCGNYGGCPFRKICSQAVETRHEWLYALTKERKWDPLKVRGDI